MKQQKRVSVNKHGDLSVDPSILIKAVHDQHVYNPSLGGGRLGGRDGGSLELRPASLANRWVLGSVRDLSPK